MLEMFKLFRQIEQLDVDQLSNALKLNGYPECANAVHSKSIDGEQFLKLTEGQISLWRLPSSQARRFWSFIQQIKQDPTQFVLPLHQNKEMTPGTSTLKKTLKENSLTNSKNLLLTGKPNVPTKENLSVNSRFNKITKEYSTKSETSTSTLTKQESKLLKNKLEQVFKKDVEEVPNIATNYNQKQPQLPPKPEFLTKTIKQNINYPPEELEDYNDGYLAPIKVDQKQTETMSESKTKTTTVASRKNSISNTGSFLSKFRKSYTNLETRQQVIENNYEKQQNKSLKSNAKTRPLPPIPVETIRDKEGNEFKSNNYDEHLAEYTAVADNDESPTRINSKINQIAAYKSDNSFDEELPEYTPIHDDDSDDSDNQESIIQKTPRTNRPLPPLPVLSENNHINQKLQVKQKQSGNIFNNDDNNDQLPEYTDVLNDEIHNDINFTVKTNVSPLHNSSSTRQMPNYNGDRFSETKQKPKQLASNSNQENLKGHTDWKTKHNLSTTTTTPTLNIPSVKLLKPRAELPKSPSLSFRNLPKPPVNLPKLPTDLPRPPPFLETENSLKTLTAFDVNEDISSLHHRPLPPLPQPSEVTEESTKDVEEDISYYSDVHFTSESYYRETDRKGARLLLSGLEDGTFLIRPSRQENFLCTLSIINRKKMFNLGIEKDSKGVLQLGNLTPHFEQPVFYGIGDIVSYYSNYPLYLSGESILLKNILPFNRR